MDRKRSTRYRIANQTRGTTLAERSEKVDTMVHRGVGLIGRSSLDVGGGLIIQPCNSVVSFFMRFTIDVVFVDAENVVCYTLKNMVPWRASKMIRKSKFVVELPAGTIDRSGTEIGDTLDIQSA